jgi:Uma2 family endonuclease
MATAPVKTSPHWDNGYPTSDGKPMAETDWHRELMVDLIEALKVYYRGQPNVYVSGNLLVFYERGNKRRHLSPDVFVVKGVPDHNRPNYLVWEERPIDLVIELTSSSTRHQDTVRKFRLYQDVLKVKEYFLFDPRQDYLDPPQQGYRLRGGVYHPIRPVAGRFPSRVLGLHLERQGEKLRLINAATGDLLISPMERAAREHAARVTAEEALRAEAAARRAAEEETERLRREVEELRRRLPDNRGSRRNGG